MKVPALFFLFVFGLWVVTEQASVKISTDALVCNSHPWCVWTADFSSDGYVTINSQPTLPDFSTVYLQSEGNGISKLALVYYFRSGFDQLQVAQISPTNVVALNGISAGDILPVFAFMETTDGYAYTSPIISPQTCFPNGCCSPIPLQGAGYAPFLLCQGPGLVPGGAALVNPTLTNTSANIGCVPSSTIGNAVSFSVQIPSIVGATNISTVFLSIPQCDPNFALFILT